MAKSNKYAIIVAGGKGLRMLSDMPKQFMLLAGKPVLMYSIEAFYEYDPKIICIVVLPENQIDYWNTVCKNHNFKTPHLVVEGGTERFFSVLNGLQHIKKNGIVAIHDGIRPLITNKIISEGFSIAEQCGSAIPVINTIDTLRFVSLDNNYLIDRTKIKRVQTPQFFDINKLKIAYSQEYTVSFTDDASVWEKAGNIVSCFVGDECNLKITTQNDLIYAEAILKK